MKVFGVVISLFIFLCSHHFGDFFFLSQDNKARLKQAHGHNNENKIFQPEYFLTNKRVREKF